VREPGPRIDAGPRTQAGGLIRSFVLRLQSEVLRYARLSYRHYTT